MSKRLFLVAALFVPIVAAIIAALYVRQELRTPYPDSVATVIVDVPRGLGSREVLRILEDQKVIRNRYVALAYLVYTRQQGRVQAGEYLFDRPMTVNEVLNKLINGTVYLHKFTVPEGLTVSQIADLWEKQKFGTAEEFMAASASAVDLVHRFDEQAVSLEGYLFPETYSFPSRTNARKAIEAMVNRFRSVLDELKRTVAPENWPLNLRDTIILASLVESEAAKAQERPVIASVYLNRLMQRILLQCDPTVVYALTSAGKYKGYLQVADLKFQSPYNTYVNPGLPPGPITNPGYASLVAAVHPAHTGYLFFVRTVDGQHTFSENLAAHNRAVAAYRAMIRKKSKGQTE